MPQTKTPVSFIATNDAISAIGFYQGIIGLDLTQKSPFAVVFSDHGQTLRVQIVADFKPPAYTAHGWQVTDIRSEIAHLVEKGVSFSRFDHMDQDDNGIWTTPNGD